MTDKKNNSELMIPEVPKEMLGNNSQDLLDEMLGSDFTPILTLCQGLSKSVMEGNCRPGDFVFWGQKDPISTLTGRPADGSPGNNQGPSP